MTTASPGSPAEIVVAVIRDTGDRAADQRMLAALAGELLPSAAPAATPVAFVVVHHCAHCGASDHGRPSLHSADGTAVAGVHLSLSRAAGRVGLAATLAAPVGIDIESIDAVAAAGLDDVAFDATERASLDALAAHGGESEARRMRASAWAAKEAVLKTAGTGLRTDPREVALDLAHPARPLALRTARTARAPDATGLTLHELTPLPDGLVGYVAVASASPTRIRFAEAHSLGDAAPASAPPPGPRPNDGVSRR